MIAWIITIVIVVAILTIVGNGNVGEGCIVAAYYGAIGAAILAAIGIVGFVVLLVINGAIVPRS